MAISRSVRTTPRKWARVVGERSFFGEGHPYAHPSDGIAKTVEGVYTRGSAIVFSKSASGSTAPCFLIAGDFDADEAREPSRRAILELLQPPMVRQRRPYLRHTFVASCGAGRVVLVEKKGRARRTVIRVLVPMPAPT